MRNKTENRLLHKSSKRDLIRSEQNLIELEDGFQMNSDGKQVQENNYLRIDTTELSVMLPQKLGQGAKTIIFAKFGKNEAEKFHIKIQDKSSFSVLERRQNIGRIRSAL